MRLIVYNCNSFFETNELTIDQFSLINRGSIFAYGNCINDCNGVNISNSGKMLRWVAVKGYGDDWTIYIHFNIHDNIWVSLHGDKVTSSNNIKLLVPCTNEVFKKYRY